MLKKTPLFEAHKKLGAKIIEFDPWLMPLYYTSIIDEHNTVRNRVGLFDVSHMGEFSIRGKDALAFVQRLITNDASRLNNNQVLYTPMCNDEGAIIDDLLVYKFSNENFMLVVNASNIEKDYKWIEEVARKFNKDVILKDISDETPLLALQGPKAEEVLQKVTDLNLSKMKYYWFKEGKVKGIETIISRTGYTGEDGFEIYLKPEHALKIWSRLLKIGKKEGIKPIGLGARDTLRLECAMLLYGNDMDETKTPLETNIAWAVKFSKENFIGKEALLKQKEEGIKQRLVGFEFLEHGIPRRNYPILKDKEKIGIVTSGSFSPTLKKGIGLGYVKTDLSEEGTEIQIQIRERAVKARIVKTPFYKRKKA
ncbi:MAG TPA: glycine cleavage system aminomethyltransferase GcvT [bacterium]|nr:glycine cleavage system aminomethyltransferase GcvT [bacterium]